jgi:hypothetical protein
VREPAVPSCRIDGAKRPWIVVERCDTCERFKDDLAAALSLFRVAGWFECRSGSFHALANAQTRRPRQVRALNNDVLITREAPLACP